MENVNQRKVLCLKDMNKEIYKYVVDKKRYERHKIHRTEMTEFYCQQCNKIYKTTTANYCRQKICHKCVINNKRKNSKAYQVLSEKDKIRFLNNEIDAKTKVYLPCTQCGKLYETNLHNYLTNHTICHKCNNNNISKRNLKSHEEIKTYVTEKYKKIPLYKNDIVEFICTNCHKTYQMLVSSFLRRKTTLCTNCLNRTKHIKINENLLQHLVHEKDKDDYKNKKILVRDLKKYDFYCEKCGEIYQTTLFGYLYDKTIMCHSCATKKSSGELKLLNYIQSFYRKRIICNDRKVLHGKEIDIYLPDLKIGFEYNGTYWHSTYHQKDSKYHYKKYLRAIKYGIRLVQIYEYNYEEQKELIKQIILDNHMGIHNESEFIADNDYGLDYSKYNYIPIQYKENKIIIKPKNKFPFTIYKAGFTVWRKKGELIMEKKNETEGQEFVSPVYHVRRVPVEQLVANEYNPNHVAPEEFKLLYDSIKCDGYTMPIVTYYRKEDDMYEIVDGFHRYSIMKRYDDIREREHGCLPVVVIDKPLEERMASTVRHNRARGTHDVDLMSNIVGELHKLGREDAWIEKHLGMSEDEVLRLKQITGLAELFRDKEFSQAWTTEDNISVNGEEVEE